MGRWRIRDRGEKGQKEGKDIPEEKKEMNRRRDRIADLFREKGEGAGRTKSSILWSYY